MNTTTNNNGALITAIGLILVAGATRFLNIPGIGFAQNFTAMGGLAIFSAHYFKPLWKGLAITFIAYLASDILLNVFVYNVDPIYMGSFVQYAALSLVVIIAYYFNKNATLLSVFGTGLFGSILFFIISNFAVWVGSKGTGIGFDYTKDLNGLLKCYTAAIPFFINFATSTIVSAGLMFYIFKGITVRKPIAIV